MRSRAPFLAIVVLTSLAHSAVGANKVLLVDDSFTAPLPPNSFTNLQSAIDAAGEGDVIRARPGIYASASVIGKSLTIVGEGTPEQPTARPGVPTVEVAQLAAGQRVVLRGLFAMESLLPFVPGPFQIHDNAGVVVVEDTVVFTTSVANATLEPKVWVQNCASVSFVRCDITGRIVNKAPLGSYVVGTALAISASTVYVHGGNIEGGPGQDAGTFPFVPQSWPGGPGIMLFSGTVHLLGAKVRGGKGGAGLNTVPCFPNESGGHGVISGGHVRIFDSTIEGGAAGAGVDSCPSAAVAGDGIQQISGTVTSWPGVARAVELNSPAETGGMSELELTGLAGDTFLLLYSAAAATIWFPNHQGATLVAFPASIASLGTLADAGTTLIPIPLPADLLPPGIDAVEIFAQAIAIGTDGDGVLTAPTAQVIARPTGL